MQYDFGWLNAEGGKVPEYRTRHALLDESITRAIGHPGSYAEFGVAEGVSAVMILELMPANRLLHLFDWYQGLPEPLEDIAPAGKFATDGPPDLKDERVALHNGLFADTLPNFIETERMMPFAFMHIDCDLYSSATEVLNLLNKFIMPGTVIQFDDYFGFKNWDQHEYKAWREYADKHEVKFSYIGRCNCWHASLRVDKKGR